MKELITINYLSLTYPEFYFIYLNLINKIIFYRNQKHIMFNFTGIMSC